MCYSFPQLYKLILNGLKQKPITGRFSAHVVDEGDSVTSICDPLVKNATFAEIVQWVWEKYYAHLDQDVVVAAETR